MARFPDPDRPDAVRVGVEHHGTTQGQTGTIVEPDTVSETLVDGMLSIIVVNGLPRVSFFVERQTKDGGSRRVLVSRLAMTVECANVLAETLRTIVSRMEVEGAIAPLPKVQVE